MTFPARENLTILVAHAAYRVAERLSQRAPDLKVLSAGGVDEIRALIPQADVACMSGFWRNDFLPEAKKLRFVQSISAGTDQFSRDAFREHGVRLASGQGANARAVAEHAIALILSLAHRLHTARDMQAKRQWRGMATNPAEREDEIGGKTLLIVGFGGIGSHLGLLARAFGMKVLAVKRNVSHSSGMADEIHPQEALPDLLPRADYVALTCPLTPETRGLMNAAAFAAMKPGAALINVARGAVVDEPAMIAALQSGRLAAAGLDCFVTEPLPEDSPLWTMENVVVTPHAGGETRAYEDRIVDLLLENIERLWRGEKDLANQIV